MHPSNPDSLSESSDDDEEWETISYGMVCQIIDHHLESTKLPYHLRYEAQTNVAEVDVANRSLGFSNSDLINVQLREVKLFDTILPKQLADYQKKRPSNWHMFMNVSQINLNLSCQLYIMLSRSLFAGYFYSMIDCH